MRSAAYRTYESYGTYKSYLSLGIAMDRGNHYETAFQAYLSAAPFGAHRDEVAGLLQEARRGS